MTVGKGSTKQDAQIEKQKSRMGEKRSKKKERGEVDARRRRWQESTKKKGIGVGRKVSKQAEEARRRQG